MYSTSMGATARWKGLPWILALLAAALLAVLIADPFRLARPAGDDPARAPSAPAPGTGSPSALPSHARVPSSPRAAPTGDPGAPSDLDPISASEPDDGPGPDYPVDLEALRARLPDNLYWQLGQPTRDPAILERRAEEERRWNELYGKVLSNGASEEEINRYYDHRRRVSEDYVEFATLVLQEHGDRLSDRDRGMYELSVKLHSARLEEIPRQTADALARREAHQQRREEWLLDGGSSGGSR